ncbi:hypothetical protein ACFSR7_15475 [Cohnella sp. GCM10020058]|uniref:hypothetical protein n=1 Tax=Cohnella sp. GCM10020058 TaxID=3317330 RepID=UPI003632EF4F
MSSEQQSTAHASWPLRQMLNSPPAYQVYLNGQDKGTVVIANVDKYLENMFPDCHAEVKRHEIHITASKVDLLRVEESRTRFVGD